jgi:hypothetical protein
VGSNIVHFTHVAEHNISTGEEVSGEIYLTISVAASVAEEMLNTRRQAVLEAPLPTRQRLTISESVESNVLDLRDLPSAGEKLSALRALKKLSSNGHQQRDGDKHVVAAIVTAARERSAPLHMAQPSTVTAAPGLVHLSPTPSPAHPPALTLNEVPPPVRSSVPHDLDDLRSVQSLHTRSHSHGSTMNVYVDHDGNHIAHSTHNEPNRGLAWRVESVGTDGAQMTDPAGGPRLRDSAYEAAVFEDDNHEEPPDEVFGGAAFWTHGVAEAEAADAVDIPLFAPVGQSSFTLCAF